MSEPVRHTPTSGLFPPNSLNVAEILTPGMLSRDIPFVGLCPLSQRRLLLLQKPKCFPTPHKEQTSQKMRSLTWPMKKTSCALPWYCWEPRGGTDPLPRDSTGVKMRKQKTPIQQEEQSFHTTCAAPSGASPGTGAQGTHLEPLSSWLSDTQHGQASAA